MATWRWLGDIQTGTSGQRVATGAGSPEGVVTAPIGSLYLRSDGSTNTAVYIKETGSGNTGWVAIGSGGTTLALRHNGTDNASQVILDLIAGTGVTLVDNGVGGLTINTSSGVASGSLSVASAIQSSPLTVNLSTQGSYDWMWLGGFTGGSLSGNIPEAGTAFKPHWKLLNGRLLSGLRFTTSAQLAGSAVSPSNFTFNSNAGDDACYNEATSPAGSPMASRQGGFFFNNNNNSLFIPFGFQWRDIPLSILTPKTLKFYVYVANATATFSARVSDGSAIDASTTIIEGGSGSEYIVTVNVTPGSYGATLSVAFTITTFVNSASSIGIEAVTAA